MTEKEINNTEELFEGAIYFGEFSVDKELVIEASNKCEPNKDEYEIIIPVFDGSKKELQDANKAKKGTKKSGKLER